MGARGAPNSLCLRNGVFVFANPATPPLRPSSLRTNRALSVAPSRPLAAEPSDLWREPSGLCHGGDKPLSRSRTSSRRTRARPAQNQAVPAQTGGRLSQTGEPPASSRDLHVPQPSDAPANRSFLCAAPSTSPVTLRMSSANLSSRRDVGQRAPAPKIMPPTPRRVARLGRGLSLSPLPPSRAGSRVFSRCV